ncbi:hypothetical protein Tco_1218113 [Tanacetum coccineum]
MERKCRSPDGGVSWRAQLTGPEMIRETIGDDYANQEPIRGFSVVDKKVYVDVRRKLLSSKWVTKVMLEKYHREKELFYLENEGNSVPVIL